MILLVVVVSAQFRPERVVNFYISIISIFEDMNDRGLSSHIKRNNRLHVLYTDTVAGIPIP